MCKTKKLLPYFQPSCHAVKQSCLEASGFTKDGQDDSGADDEKAGDEGDGDDQGEDEDYELCKSTFPKEASLRDFFMLAKQFPN